MDHLLVDEFKEINQLPDLCVPCVHTNVPCVLWASLVGSDGKESACNSGNPSFIPGSGRSPGEGNGNPLQYPCLDNSMDRQPGGLTAHRVAKSWTRLNN